MGKTRENTGKRRKTEKETDILTKVFLKNGICETEQDAIKKKKKKLGKQKGFLEIKTITEIKIHKVGDTTEKIFEKAD